MTPNEEKMCEEICSLRASLKTVAAYLEDLLETGLPGKGRGQDAKESIEVWYEDRGMAIKKAEELLAATTDYQGAISR